jgi:hypothetical protein
VIRGQSSKGERESKPKQRDLLRFCFIHESKKEKKNSAHSEFVNLGILRIFVIVHQD